MKTTKNKNNKNKFKKNYFKKKNIFFKKTKKKKKNKKKYNKNIKQYKKTKNNKIKKAKNKNYTQINKKNKIHKKKLTNFKIKKNKKILINNQNTTLNLSKSTYIEKNKTIKNIKKINQNINTKKYITSKKTPKTKKLLTTKIKKNKNIYLKKYFIKNEPKDEKQPIVTIMGHVNQGKTSLLNYIRLKKIKNNEYGNITQQIKAYQIKTKNKKITFIDTPGHSSFINMRIRGIKITDIIILLISIDDGIMPQTIEIIKYAKKNNVPIIIVINKIDKKEYINNIDLIKKEISKYGIIPKEWGGENIFIEISVKLGLGINKLIKSIILLSEKMKLKTNTKDLASGIVIESKINKNKGLMTNILIQNGTLKIGDIILCGYKYGRIKSIHNDLGNKIKSATPSTPVTILGLYGNITSGEKFYIIQNIKKAKKISKYIKKKLNNKEIKNKKTQNIEKIFSDLKKNKKNKINIIIKTNTYGSIDAILESIKNLPSSKIKINIISSGIGNINKTDINLAKTSKSTIIGFNTYLNNYLKKNISNNKITIYTFKKIYDLIKKLKKIISFKTKKNNNIKIIGKAKIKNIFKLSKFNSIAGCIVLEGNIKKTKPIRILRNNDIIYEGKLKSLRRYKKNVHSISKGIECGIEIKNYSKINIGDIIETLDNKQNE